MLLSTYILIRYIDGYEYCILDGTYRLRCWYAPHIHSRERFRKEEEGGCNGFVSLLQQNLFALYGTMKKERGIFAELFSTLRGEKPTGTTLCATRGHLGVTV